MDTQNIIVRGAREHNLRDVALELPRNRLICFTGVSGSGKSSLAFDTLYAEGQRRYIESLSAYARQFLGQLPKPNVDLITGLSPAIAIQQQKGGWNPRSTVGTVTQIHDYLRVLFARVGRQHCPQCSRPITAQTREQIAGRIRTLPAGRKLMILAPVVRGQKGEYRDLFEDMVRRGYARARVDGQVVRLAEAPALDRNIRHNIEIVVDRLTLSANLGSRLAEAVDNALQLGEGTLLVVAVDEDGRTAARTRRDAGELLLSSRYACPECDLGFAEPTPQLFSFNSPTGMCPTCDGLGTRFDFDPELMVTRPNRSFLNLAVAPMRTRIGRWRRHIYTGVARHVGFDLRTPWQDLTPRARLALLYGTGDEHITYEWRTRWGVWKHGGPFAGVIAELREKHRKTSSSFVRAYYEQFMRSTTCPSCQGARLNAQARAVLFQGLTISAVSALSVSRAVEFFRDVQLGPTETIIADEVLKEIRGRLQFLVDVGLDYLALDRTAPTLSGGEAQRIRLAAQIGAGLVGVLYILDEPSIGLHPRDNEKLLASLLRLRDLGNTVIVVEHDEATMRAADLLVDFGPGPGVRGGEVVAVGSVTAVSRNRRSLTGAYLTGRESIAVPAERRPVSSPPGEIPRKPRSKRITKARKT